MLLRSAFNAAFLTTIAVVLAACGSSGGPASTDNGTSTAGAEVQQGEATAVPYTDARYQYRVDAPGHMTANADGTATFIGPSERLEIAVVQGSSAADPGAIAGQDVNSLAASVATFHQLSSPATTTVGGHGVVKFSYTWNAGTSSVTGKAIELTSVRYYITKNSTTLAVITYGIVSNQYDPQGADDIASTFQWL